MNNAKLAHSVAAERSRYAELYKRYIENEKFFVSQQVNNSQSMDYFSLFSLNVSIAHALLCPL